MRPLRPIVGIAFILALAGAPAARGQVPYNFTRIAITGAGSPYAQLFAPSLVSGLDASNTVSFGAVLTTGQQRISTGNGGTPTTVAETGPATGFQRFNAAFPPGAPIVTAIQPTTNQVAFFAITNAGVPGVFRGDGATTVTIASATQNPPFTGFSAGPNINAGGVVSFAGAISPGNERVLTGAGSGLTQIATTGPTPVGTVTAFNPFTGINNGGLVSFAAQYNTGRQAVFVGNGVPATEIASNDAGTGIASFPGPSAVSDANRVAFIANLAAGGQAVFSGTGGALTTHATTAGPYAAFGLYADITTGGAVVFGAALDDGTQGIFTGPDPVLNKIVRTGDVIDGLPVQSVVLAPSFVNDLGRVAFLAEFGGGRQGVYVATPVPEPAGVLGVAAAGLGAAGIVRRWRRGRFTSAGQPAG